MKKVSKKELKTRGYWSAYKRFINNLSDDDLKYSAGARKGNKKEEIITNYKVFKELWDDEPGTNKQKWKKFKESVLYESDYNTARKLFKALESKDEEYQKLNKKERSKYRKQKISEFRTKHTWDIYEEYKDQIEADKQRLRELNNTNKEINEYISANYFGS